MIFLRPILSDSEPKHDEKNGVPISSEAGDHQVGRGRVDLERLGQENSA